MSKQKNSTSKKIQSDNINDDTNFEDTDKDNDVIYEQKPILDLEILEKINKFKNCFCKFEILDNYKKIWNNFFCFIPSKEISIMIKNNHLKVKKWIVWRKG